MNIRERLQHEAVMWQSMGHPALMQEFVLRNGTVSLGAACPGKRLTPKECFRNAAMSLEDGDYCEGYGWRKSLPIIVHHAWRVKDGTVIDRTWNDPEDCQYMGVIFKEKVLWQELRRNKVYGILDTGMINVRLMVKVDPGMIELLPEQLKRKFTKV